MIIDSHCHLDFDILNKNINSVLKNAESVGVKYFLTICTDNQSFKKIESIIKNFKNIFGTYGIHPHESKKYLNITSDEISKKLLDNNKIIGVGESGLDFHYNHSDKVDQKKCFLKHINASQETSKTLIVHSRNAEKEIYDILLNEYRNKKFNILMHCFTGSKVFAHKLLDIGCYFSASGIITFKNNSELVETFKSIPNNRILVETDSPYLSPEPHRGKINEPKNIIHTIKFLANVKQLSLKEIENLTSKNFFNLFNIKV